MGRGVTGWRGTALLAAGAAALVAWTAYAYSLLSVALVIASLALAGASLWSCRTLLGPRTAYIFLAIAAALGWFAEQTGSTLGWFFGDYSYTRVLGPRLGAVPIVIPLMWFGLCHIGLVMASLVLWRQPTPPAPGWKAGALAALLAAMIVTAFDLGADPYFVYQLKAWIMVEKDGGWFGETVRGFEGWMIVSFAIVAAFQAIARPRLAAAPEAAGHRAALVPILLYAGMIVFQVLMTQPVALRVIAFFAMGIPALAAAVAWWQWREQPRAAPRDRPEPAVHWKAMTHAADPLADRTVAAIGTDRLAQASRLMAAWTTNASLVSWAPPADADPEVVAALRAYIEEGRRLPAWIRTADVERAEDVFMDYGPMSCTLLFCASLPECYVLPHLSEVLHAAGQLEAHTEHRIRQTAAMVFPVMMKGGLTRGEGGGVAQVLKVRLIHATIRHLILRGPPEQAAGRIEPLAPVGPAENLHQALLANGWDVERQGLPCNQVELAYTLLTFGYVFLKGMRTLGLPLTAQQEQAYLHAWNVVGHVLGIRNELMAHTMEEAAAMFDGLQAMARLNPSAPDVRPGLGRALMATMARTIRLPVIRQLPVPLARWLIGRDTAREIGVDQRVGLLTRFVFAAGLLAARAIDATLRLVVPHFSLTRMFTRVVGYHLLTRFLLDQTRPLGLPDELLGPMQDTVAGWQHDGKSPGWLNRLEDRLTTVGAWRSAA